MFKRFAKKTVLLLVLLFVLLSLLPYLIPLQPLDGNRYAQAYSNSLFTVIDGVELHYRLWDSGEPADNNILLVHGLGGSTFSWRYTAPFLEEQGYRVIAVDLPGFGLSERKIGFDHSSESRAKLLWSFLEQLESGSEWNLIGHSMGGATVAAMALQEPDEAGSVVLVAGALAQFEPSIFSYLISYPPVGRWFRVLGARYLLTEKRVEQMLASAYGQKPAPEDVTGYYLPLTVINTDAVFVDLIKTAPLPLLERVGTLKMPVLCIWGEDDAWVALSHGKDLARIIPGAELVVLEEEGHCPMETAPHLFNEKLLLFLP